MYVEPSDYYWNTVVTGKSDIKIENGAHTHDAVQDRSLLQTGEKVFGHETAGDGEDWRIEAKGQDNSFIGKRNRREGCYYKVS